MWTRRKSLAIAVVVLLAGWEMVCPLAKSVSNEQVNLALLSALVPAEHVETCFGVLPRHSYSGVPTGIRKEWQVSKVIILDSHNYPRQAVWLSLAQGNFVQAREALTQTSDPVFRLWLVMLDSKTGQFDEAASLLVRDYSQALTVLLQRGWILADKGMLDVALECFEVAVRLDRDGARALIGRGRMRQLSGEYLAALADFDLAIARCSMCYQAYLYRGQLRLVMGETSDAIEADFQRAVTLAPDQVDTLLQWGYWLRDRGQYAEAIGQFQKTIQLYPDVLEVVLALADTYGAIGQPQQAISLLDQALVRFTATPQLDQIRARLSRYQAMLRQP